MANIQITDSCIKCGKCIKVCPSVVFQREDNGASKAHNPESCIVCGHCVAVCPSSSIAHEAFPADKVHKIDYSQYPKPEQVMLLCKARRSNRAFSTKQVPDEFISQILEAAHRAPTASNMQGVEFTLVTDAAKLKEVSSVTMAVFGRMIKVLKNPLLRPILKMVMPDAYRYVPLFTRLLKEQENGNDLILRGATAALFIHTPTSSRFGAEDANLAYQNGSLMAESLGVNQFYMGFVCSGYKQDRKKRLNSLLGLEGRTVHSAMALGMPQFRYENFMDKKDIIVTEIR